MVIWEEIPWLLLFLEKSQENPQELFPATGTGFHRTVSCRKRGLYLTHLLLALSKLVTLSTVHTYFVYTKTFNGKNS